MVYDELIGPFTRHLPISAAKLPQLLSFRPAVVHGKHVYFPMCDLDGSIGAGVMIADPTAP